MKATSSLGHLLHMASGGLFSYSPQKNCHYQVHVIKICTETRDYSNDIFLLHIRFCIVIYCVFCRGAHPCAHYEMNFQRSLTAVSLLKRTNTLKRFCMKSSSIQKKWRGPEQKQSWECNVKLEANSHEIGSMTLWVEILKNNLCIKQQAFPGPLPFWSDC